MAHSVHGPKLNPQGLQICKVLFYAQTGRLADKTPLLFQAAAL
jgi:hypothetical protein